MEPNLPVAGALRLPFHAPVKGLLDKQIAHGRFARARVARGLRIRHRFFVSMAVMAMVGGNPALAAECIDYGAFLHWVGNVETPGSAVGVAVGGSYAYVATRTLGFQVVDISTSATPSIIGSVDTPGEAWDVAISGSYAYVVGGSSGLQVVDITDPSSPSIVGSVDTPGSASGVSVVGSYAYVAR